MRHTHTPLPPTHRTPAHIALLRASSHRNHKPTITPSPLQPPQDLLSGKVDLASVALAAARREGITFSSPLLAAQPRKVAKLASAAAAALAAINAEKGIDEDEDDVLAKWFGPTHDDERTSPGRTSGPGGGLGVGGFGGERGSGVMGGGGARGSLAFAAATFGSGKERTSRLSPGRGSPPGRVSVSGRVSGSGLQVGLLWGLGSVVRGVCSGVVCTPP